MPIIEETLQVVRTGIYLGHRWANVAHLRFQDGLTLTQSDADDIAACWESVDDGYLGAFSDGWGVDEFIVTDVRTEDGPRYIVPLPYAGTDASHDLPAQTALVISLATAKRGKSFRGRMYLNGFCESVNDTNGQPTSAALDTYRDYAQQLFVDFAALGGVTDDFSLVVASRVLGQSELVTSVLVDPRWDTQRRRTRS